jgi:hypothetical protein
MVDPQLQAALAHGHVSQAILPLLAMALPSVISGLGALFGMKKKKDPNAANTSATSSAMNSLLQQQTQQMQQESPLRKMLLSQSAGLLPTYMKQDPGYAQWMASSAPQAQAAMTSAAQARKQPYDA